MQTRKIVIDLEEAGSYCMRLGPGVLDKLGFHLLQLEGFHEGMRLLVLSDENVARVYGASVRKTLKEAGFQVRSISVAAGELSKQTNVVVELWEAMAQLGFDRTCAVVALGGGVVGDLGGFLASTYLRGVPLVQVPTTLLAMADSSVGGKTAVNLQAGKNLVGTFCQPAYICADTKVLSTLDQREWSCGCAEIAKMALLSKDDFFFWLIDNAKGLAQRDDGVVSEALIRCVAFKAEVVASDVFDRFGVRECLNFGHTFGHALESAFGGGVYSHGHCVAEGMRFATRLGAAMLGTPLEVVREADALFDELGLSSLASAARNLSCQDLMARMKRDKKAVDGQIRFVLLDENARWKAVAVPDSLVEEHLRAWQASGA